MIKMNRKHLHTTYHPFVTMFEITKRMVVIFGSTGEPIRNLYIECLQFTDKDMYIITDSTRSMKALYIKDLSSMTDEEFFQESLVLPHILNLDIIRAIQKKFHEFNSNNAENLNELVGYDI